MKCIVKLCMGAYLISCSTRPIRVTSYAMSGIDRAGRCQILPVRLNDRAVPQNIFDFFFLSILLFLLRYETLLYLKPKTPAIEFCFVLFFFILSLIQRAHTYTSKQAHSYLTKKQQ